MNPQKAPAESLKAPGILRAISFVRSNISSGAFVPGVPIPERGALARMVGVGPRTVSSAIARLKSEGVLDGVKGQRAFPAGSRDIHGKTNNSGWANGIHSKHSGKHKRRLGNTSFDIVAQQLRHDIACGRYEPAARLPGRKALQSRYGCSYEPLRKALGLLVTQGVLHNQGRNYSVPVVSVPSSHARIVLLTYSDIPQLPTHSRDKAFIDAVEIQCRKHNVAVENLIVCEKNGRMLLHRNGMEAPLDISVIEECLGIIYLMSWGGCVNPGVLSWLAHTGKPVSIHDWTGESAPPRSLAQNRLTQWVSCIGSTTPGFHVGRFLRSLGHRHITFFAPLEEPYAMARLKGLREAFVSANGETSVTPCIRASEADDLDFFELVKKRYRMFRATEDIPPGLPKSYGVGVRDFGRKTWDIYENAARYELLEPLFLRALKHPENTAWVGNDDAIALMMWSFLQANGICVPREMSVVGFNNSFEALEQDLSSYDFDFSAMASVSLSFLLRPNLARGVKTLSRPSIEGFVIERGSTARA